MSRFRHWRARRRLLRDGFDRSFPPGGELRIVYTEEKEVFITTPDGSRWRAKPGIILTASSCGETDLNSSAAELIEAGPE